MQAQSRKEALARTVRLLTRNQIAVSFRGNTPYVAANPRTGKAERLNLPEIPDEASPLLVDALQGYLDHEVGHVFYTPFSRHQKDPMDAALANLLEDIRLEKLLPRDLPGTRDNLERMYVNWIPLLVLPGIKAAVEAGDPERIISVILMPTMRALAGQATFQQLMDSENLWPRIKVLTDRLPGFDVELQAMETYDDVLAAVAKLKKAMDRPKQPMIPPPPASCPDPKDESETSPSPSSDGDDDDAGAEGGAQSEENDDGEGTSDSAGDDGDNDEDGDPDGDGSEGDAGDDGDASSGDDDDGADTGEADGEDAGDDPAERGDGDDQSDDSSSDGRGDRDERAGEGDEDGDGDAGEDGKRNVTMTEALRRLDPTLRRALFLHKKKNRSIEAIAQEMQTSNDDVKQMLREARRGLAEIMRS